MKDSDDILARAMEQMKNQQVPPGPPKELVDATIARLAEAADELGRPTAKLPNITPRIRASRNFLKFAAAAILLLGVGYLVGSLSAPKPPDARQLYAAIEPVIQQELLEPMHHSWLLALASSNAELKDELHNEFRQDLNRCAVQTLAASGAATNELLREFIAAVKATQARDLRSVELALRQIEADRVRDKAQLTNSLETFVVLYDDELQRTKQDIVQLIYNQPIESPADVHESPRSKMERSEE
jgi:hypothetical protein